MFFRQLCLYFTLWADVTVFWVKLSSPTLLGMSIKFATLPRPRAELVHIFPTGIFLFVFVSYLKSCHDSGHQIPLFYKECLKSNVYVKRLIGKLDTLKDCEFSGYSLFEWAVLDSEFDGFDFFFKLDWLDTLKIYSGKYKVMAAANVV